MSVHKKFNVQERISQIFICHRSSSYFYRPQRSCGQGNIFTPVCHSVHRGGMVVSHKTLRQNPPPRTRHTPPPRNRHTTPPDQTPPQTRHTTPPRTRHTTTTPPPGSRLRHTVYERPVRIILECILVQTLKIHD